MGALAIQKRSLRGFSRESTSTRVTLAGLAAPRGRSPCGVLASRAAGPASRVVEIAWRRFMRLFSVRAATVFQLRGNFGQLLAEQRIFWKFGGQGGQQLLGFARLLFAKIAYREQDLGEGPQVMAGARYQLQVFDALILAAVHAIEVHKPADKERQAAQQILVQAGGEVGVVELRIDLQE